MLSKRIIACLDVRDGQVVKGVNFEGLRNAGDPAELAERYNEEGIDEVVILDVTATLEGRRALAADRLGGGEAHLHSRSPLAAASARKTMPRRPSMREPRKVSLNTAALTNPDLITRLASRYGSQAAIVAIDAKWVDGRALVYVRSGQSGTEREAVEWAKEAADRGAGEILLTSIDRDGTKKGFDCELTAAVSKAVGIPVIASGGAGSLEDFFDVFNGGLRRRGAGRLDLSLFRARRARSQGNASQPRNPRASLAMLIPAIDLKGGKVVQLIQGEKLAIETTDLDYWIGRFAGYPRVNVIDLDAAMSSGSNDRMVRDICGRLPCQVGGGVRSPERALQLCETGAKKVIVGSALFKDGRADVESARRFAETVGADRLIGAVDSKAGRVVTHGWKSPTGDDGRRGRSGARALLRRISLYARGQGRADEGNRHRRDPPRAGRDTAADHRGGRRDDAGGDRRASMPSASTPSSGWPSILVR